MDLEGDENAPPPKVDKPNQAGYMSPFGFLAGVRAMLSPAVKDQTSESPVSSERSVLRDVNTAASPKPKNALSVAQVPGAQGPAAGDSQFLPAEKGTWSERGDRNSIASENSFVSALSDNTSLPDILQSAPGRPNGVESDTDTSTAYESAGETEGNVSSRDDFSSSFCSEKVLNDPRAVSSPYIAELVESVEVDSVPKKTKSDSQLEDSFERNDGNVSLSGLVDQLGSLSLSTPFKSKCETPGKAHITLDSDVSGDIITSPGSHDDSGLNSDPGCQEKLDSTFTDSYLEETELATDKPEEKKTTQNLNETVNISSDSSADDVLIVGAEQTHDAEINGSLFSEISLTERKLLEDLGRTLNSSDFYQSELSATEAKLLEGFDHTFNVSLAESQASTLCPDDDADDEVVVLDETVIEAKPHTAPSDPEVEQAVGSDSIIGSSSSTLESTPAVCVKAVEEASSESLDKTEAILYPSEPHSSVHEVYEESQTNTHVHQECDVSPVDTVTKEDIVSNCDFVATSSSAVLPDNSECLSANPIDVKESDGESSTSALDSDPVKSVNATQTLPCGQVTPLHKSCSPEEVPLPVRVPKSFEELLAEKLAVEELPEPVPQPEVKATPACSLDDAPLPVNPSKTFEELLEEQLAAQGQSALPPPEPVKTSNSVCFDEVPLSVKEQRAFEEVLAEQLEKEVSEALEHEAVKGIVSEEDEGTKIVEDSDTLKTQEEPLSQTFEEAKSETGSSVHGEETVSPSASVASDETCIAPKAPRTFEEILAAALAGQCDPEQAVPSFSILQPGVASPAELDESFARIISSETTPLDLEREPVLTTDTIPDIGFDSLMERCKLQEQDLEQGETAVHCVPTEISPPSLSCPNESLKANSTMSEDSVSSDGMNQTIVFAKPNQSTEKSRVEFSPKASPAKISPGEPILSEQFGVPLNLEDEEFRSGDAFKDPSAFDFLSLHGGSRSARDLRKESLYVKFDPLIGSLVSDSFSNMHPENSSHNRPEAPAVAQESSHEVANEQHSLNVTEKLISLSPSAAKKQTQDSTEGSSCTTPAKSTSVKSTPVKTPAHIMLNETLESIGSRGTLVKQEDLIKKLQEHQSVLEEQDKAYQERISNLEQRIQELEIQDIQKVEQLQEKEKQLQEKDKQLREKVQSLGELNVIMKEYEKTISRLVAEKSQEKTALEDKQAELITERDQAQQHLNNMEIAFADIHTKYERVKSVVEAFKKNEETLNAALNEKQANFDKMQNMYDMLKSHAVAKLEKANQDLEAMTQKHQQENAKLKAIIKKLEIKSKSLEETLEQKAKENQALTAICDELINKVGE